MVGFGDTRGMFGLFCKALKNNKNDNLLHVFALGKISISLVGLINRVILIIVELSFEIVRLVYWN